MKRLLERDVLLVRMLPDSAPADFTALADQKVTLPDLKTFAIVWMNIDIKQIVGVDTTPLNVDIAQVGYLMIACAGLAVEHFAERGFCDLAERNFYPSVWQLRAQASSRSSSTISARTRSLSPPNALTRPTGPPR